MIRKFFSKKQDQENAHDQALMKKAALALRIINHPLRMQILRIMNQHGGMTVTEICHKLPVAPSVVSQELTILLHQGIVTVQRNGEKILYTVNYNRIDEIREISRKL